MYKPREHLAASRFLGTDCSVPALHLIVLGSLEGNCKDHLNIIDIEFQINRIAVR